MEGHHGYAKTREKGGQIVSTTADRGELHPTRANVLLGPKQSRIFSFQFASLLVSKLLKFLHNFEVLEGS